jgi:hypothetical protein
MNLACVLIKPLLMLMVIVVVLTKSMTSAWRYEKTTNLKRDVDEIDKLQ